MIPAYTPVDRPKIGLSHPCTIMASLCISPHTAASRILSNTTHQGTISSYVSLGAAGQAQPVPFNGLSYQADIQPGTPRMGTGGSIDINQLNFLDTYMLDAFPARGGLVSYNGVPTINTHTSSHATPSGLGSNSTAPGYTACNNPLVPSSLPPISVPQLDNQPNGFQPRSYQCTPAQQQPRSTFMGPPAPRNPSSGPPPEAASTSRAMTLGRPSNQAETQIRTILAR